MNTDNLKNIQFKKSKIHRNDRKIITKLLIDIISTLRSERHDSCKDGRDALASYCVSYDKKKNEVLINLRSKGMFFTLRKDLIVVRSSMNGIGHFDYEVAMFDFQIKILLWIIFYKSARIPLQPTEATKHDSL